MRALGLLFLLLITGCSRASERAAGSDQSPYAPVLVSYERLRAALAADEMAPVAGHASRLVAAARVNAPGAAAAELAAVLAAAQGLEALVQGPSFATQTQSDQWLSVRKQFGELSKALLALLAREPQLRMGRHLFSCPMAPGFQQWVQVKSGLENPYMGKAMLECGSSEPWPAPGKPG